MRPSSTAIVEFAAAIRIRIDPPEAETRHNRQAEVLQIDILPPGACVELLHGGTDRSVARTQQGEARLRSRRDVRGVVVDVVFDLMHNAA